MFVTPFQYAIMVFLSKAVANADLDLVKTSWAEIISPRKWV